MLESERILAEVTAVLLNHGPRLELSRNSKKLAEHIVQLLQEADYSTIEVFETDDLDEFQRDDDASDPAWDVEEHLSAEEQPAVAAFPDSVKFTTRTVPKSRVEMAINYYYGISKRHPNGTRKLRTLHSVSTRHRFIENDTDLRKLRTLHETGHVHQNSRAVISFISQKLHEQVLDSLDRRVVLKDDDLQQMIDEIKQEHRLECNFYGSHGWLNSWKRAHRISSRNVTTFISKRHHVTSASIQESSKEFVKMARQKFTSYTPLQIFNMDQSGFQKEMYSKRTLAHTGQKIVEVATSSANGHKQSYTVLPLLRFDGVLHPILFVVLAEPSGSFPRLKPIFTARNLVVFPSRSHIMGTDLMKKFMKEVVFTQDMPDNVCLIADSWPVWKKDNEIASVKPPQNTYEMLIIPPGATGDIQPLDVGIFNQFKGFEKKIIAYAQRKVPSFLPFQRDNILKVLSLTYWQISSPLFHDWRLNAWHLAGYSDFKPPDFVTPPKHCFGRGSLGQCEAPLCTLSSFILCAYCAKKFCFKHFVEDFHQCV